uniref:Uncharacterized protein n=1 Tax=Glossina pallidipes TaxID=7398 RepID=A0A1B0AC13_GLOPL
MHVCIYADIVPLKLSKLCIGDIGICVTRSKERSQLILQQQFYRPYFTNYMHIWIWLCFMGSRCLLYEAHIFFSQKTFKKLYDLSTSSHSVDRRNCKDSKNTSIN